MEADFHREYGIGDLAGELSRRTWRWFAVRVSGLSPDSAWTQAIHPFDPATGARAYEPAVIEITDPAAIEQFFRGQAH